MPRNLNNITQTNGYSVIKPDIKLEWSSAYMAKTNQGTGNCGKIIPVYMRELIPNQKVEINQDVALQFTPFVTNLFHEIKGELMTFFVPYRICAFMRPTENFGDEEVDDIREEADQLKWEAFITGGLTGKTNIKLDTFSLAKLKKANNNSLIGTLADYFGMPTHITQWGSESLTTPDEKTSVLQLPFNAYNLIYNEKLRNPDFTQWKKMIGVNSLETIKERGEVATAYWNADRFTRARKWQQRGIVPTIPINSELAELAVKLSAQADTSGQTGNVPSVPAGGTATTIFANPPMTATVIDNDLKIGLIDPNSQGGYSGTSSPKISGSVEIPENFANASMNYNDFVYNLAILRYEVNNARIKPRYTEQLKYRFGIIPQDSRFNEPEFIESHSFNIGVDTNTATAAGSFTEGGEPITSRQGEITGQAWGGGRSMGYEYKAQEHGLLMTLMIVRPIGVYEGGLERFWKKSRTRFDFPTPELMNTPDIGIKRGELHFTGNETTDEDLFGWQSIYDEYRTETNQVCGLLRPSAPENLASYTLARYWEDNAVPELNDTFLKCNPDMARIKQYTNQPDFIFFHRNETRTAMPMPLINEPINLGA